MKIDRSRCDARRVEFVTRNVFGDGIYEPLTPLYWHLHRNGGQLHDDDCLVCVEICKAIVFAHEIVDRHVAHVGLA